MMLEAAALGLGMALSLSITRNLYSWKRLTIS